MICRSAYGLSPSSCRPIVCVQGLGFVGAAMAAAVAAARTQDATPHYDVIGIELDSPQGRRRAEALMQGRFPFQSSDASLHAAVRTASGTGNLAATTDPGALTLASIAVIDVHLDVRDGEDGPTAEMEGFEAAVRTLGEHLPAGALVVVETTVPPGTCENVVKPILANACRNRGLADDAILLAHSYERVMPGPDYLESIIRFWRVYSGADERAADACASFLTKVIDTGAFPLRRMNSMTASETAKVLENSYRAANIAFIDEWGRFAEAARVDLFEVLDAIRDRPTHNNIRQPGFGVGGYCLTKDPLFPVVSARTHFPDAGLAFPFAELMTRVNRYMPIGNLDRVAQALGGNVAGKTLMLLGLAYRSELDDTRYSASETFVREALKRGAKVIAHDPNVRFWEEMSLAVDEALPDPACADAVVFAVPHQFYQDMDVAAWLGAARPHIFDCDNVLTRSTRRRLREIGCQVHVTGSGTGC